MNQKTENFMRHVLGVGASPVIDALSKDESLSIWGPVRTIAAWINSIEEKQNTFNVPGCEGVMDLQKSEDGSWSGRVVGEQEYAFVDVPTSHVVALLSVVLECTPEITKSESNRSISQLGKTIDLLVKTTKGGAGGGSAGSASGTGAVAKPIAPTPPIEHTAKAPEVTQAKVRVKLPRKSKKPKETAYRVYATAKISPTSAASPAQGTSLTLSEKDMKSKCHFCQVGQFTGDSFTGCFCFKSLAKSVQTRAVPGGIVLTLGSDWDEDAVDTLSELFRR